MSQGIEAQTGNYMHAHGATRRRKAGRKEFIVGIAGAYNAFGLIGPENNGLFVLNDTNKRVCADRICPMLSGYFGPGKEQWEEMARVMRMPDSEFFAYVKAMPTYRENSL